MLNDHQRRSSCLCDVNLFTIDYVKESTRKFLRIKWKCLRTSADSNNEQRVNIVVLTLNTINVWLPLINTSGE
jgi:hypothetical protein